MSRNFSVFGKKTVPHPNSNSNNSRSAAGFPFAVGRPPGKRNGIFEVNFSDVPGFNLNFSRYADLFPDADDFFASLS